MDKIGFGFTWWQLIEQYVNAENVKFVWREWQTQGKYYEQHFTVANGWMCFSMECIFRKCVVFARKYVWWMVRFVSVWSTYTRETAYTRQESERVRAIQGKDHKVRYMPLTLSMTLSLFVGFCLILSLSVASLG